MYFSLLETVEMIQNVPFLTVHWCKPLLKKYKEGTIAVIYSAATQGSLKEDHVSVISLLGSNIISVTLDSKV